MGTDWFVVGAAALPGTVVDAQHVPGVTPAQRDISVTLELNDPKNGPVRHVYQSPPESPGGVI